MDRIIWKGGPGVIRVNKGKKKSLSIKLRNYMQLKLHTLCTQGHKVLNVTKKEILQTKTYFIHH